jgi:glycerate-2-kinase
LLWCGVGPAGTDGPTDAAGAFVDGETVKRAQDVGLDPLEYLASNDSYTFFEKLGNLFVTGPTRTNVMDVHLLMLHRTGGLYEDSGP